MRIYLLVLATLVSASLAAQKSAWEPAAGHIRLPLATWQSVESWLRTIQVLPASAR